MIKISPPIFVQKTPDTPAVEQFSSVKLTCTHYEKSNKIGWLSLELDNTLQIFFHWKEEGTIKY